jgi:hypothetical protein
MEWAARDRVELDESRCVRSKRGAKAMGWLEEVNEEALPINMGLEESRT